MIIGRKGKSWIGRKRSPRMRWKRNGFRYLDTTLNALSDISQPKSPTLNGAGPNVPMRGGLRDLSANTVVLPWINQVQTRLSSQVARESDF